MYDHIFHLEDVGRWGFQSIDHHFCFLGFYYGITGVLLLQHTHARKHARTHVHTHTHPRKEKSVLLVELYNVPVKHLLYIMHIHLSSNYTVFARCFGQAFYISA